ncbi:hypothetical protein G6O69_15830 [Pseudenhygromyxa sp. WMMC2535]|uniref:hypothetical protein n=1 Tax=Pseudenhygromyxa sp. WMMC2535 TaxID=2712867 RepID=UPI001595C172|nr:hypothetical protein [Pseudenhygromyxa sp. WMMC2535]NVB39313.1 hypothetical protein [Pseudenhygromyxa sp. WMMC2535]
MDVRRGNRDEFIELTVPSVVPNVQGADQEEPQAADDGEGETFRAEGIIGSDDREIRSAYSGHSMTSVKQSWVRIGGLPPDGWDLEDSDIDNTSGTATKIGPRHLLTVGHAVWANGFFYPKDWWAGEDGVAATSVRGRGLEGSQAPDRRLLTRREEGVCRAQMTDEQRSQRPVLQAWGPSSPLPRTLVAWRSTIRRMV